MLAPARTVKSAPLPIRVIFGHTEGIHVYGYLGCKQKLRHAVNDAIGLEDA
jgi:hypothetical protein